jgi:hypothetical protein
VPSRDLAQVGVGVVVRFWAFSGDGQPSLLLGDEEDAERAQRRTVIEILDRQLDRSVENGWIESSCLVDDLADQPDVVIDHAGDEVHAIDLSVGGKADAPRRNEMNATRRRELDVSRWSGAEAGSSRASGMRSRNLTNGSSVVTKRSSRQPGPSV